MRKLLTTLCALLLSAVGAQSQTPTFDAPVQAYLDFCLQARTAMAQRDVAKLEECLAESDKANFVFHGTNIKLSPNASFEAVDSAALVSMEGHQVFETWYVDSLLLGIENPSIIDAPVMKRATVNNCFVEHRAIDAHGKCVFKYEGGGDMQLFALAERDGLLRVTVENVKGAAEKFHHTATGTADSPAAKLQWQLENDGQVLLTVENLGDKAVSFVVASN